MMNFSSTGSFRAAFSRLSICANDSSPTTSGAMSVLSPARASGSTPSITYVVKSCAASSINSSEPIPRSRARNSVATCAAGS